jgi:hypothetical protein
VATDTKSSAAASRKFRNIQPAQNHFSKHGIRHWKNWLCELSVLAPVNSKICECSFTTDVWGLPRKLKHCDSKTQKFGDKYARNDRRSY